MQFIRKRGYTINTENKLTALRNIIASYKKAVVAYSGGVDSTFLLRVAHDVLGTDALAVTIDSPLSPAQDLTRSDTIIQKWGISHHTLFIDLLMNEKIRANPNNRCYHCKKELFSTIRDFALAKGISAVLEGSNTDDIHDYRPGMQALEELGIHSPLKDAGLTKNEIRHLARQMGLPNWDRPSTPCLATRIPPGTPITVEVLKQVDRAEELLHAMGINELRVRVHGDLARIEVPREAMPLFIDEEHSARVSAEFRKLGFRHIALDIDGYRMGSMNKSAHNEEE
ncbi:MAG: TIGR00268 family protein [Spirochaetae bacterium HGW-Spirochaetae-1]|jgi:uncharacterized protein|nr:MAG: TIGR00268 family protein [Spirochaetae bacterium HGW-Spirochaetae-1]